MANVFEGFVKVSFVSVGASVKVTNKGKEDEKKTVKEGRKAVYLWRAGHNGGQLLSDIVKGDVGLVEEFAEYIKPNGFGRECDAAYAAFKVSEVTGVPVSQKIMDKFNEYMEEHNKWAEVDARKAQFLKSEEGKEHFALKRAMNALGKLEKDGSCEEVTGHAKAANKKIRAWYEATTENEIDEEWTNCDEIVTVKDLLQAAREMKAKKAA